jgi:hypothetical protein
MDNLNEHDITKSMLNVIREGVTNDVIDLTGGELQKQHDLFRDAISPRVDFNVFKIYPNNKNVVFSGKFQDMNGMEFQFSLEDTEGLYINASNLQLTDEVMTRLQRLKGFYKNWADEWSNKLATEYKAQ